MIMNLILCICAIYSLVFLIKETDGPFGFFNWLRNKLLSNKYVGVFFYKLLDCWYCSGCHAGYVIYLLHTPKHLWLWNDFIIWMLAGGSISFIMNLIVSLLINLINFLNTDKQ